MRFKEKIKQQKMLATLGTIGNDRYNRQKPILFVMIPF